jgi:amino acid transporter
MGVSGPKLKRSIGLRTIVSTSAGLTFASSTFLVVVQIACFLAGDSAWIAILIAGLLCALAAAAFSELNGMWPSVNGIRLYILKAFGEKTSLITSLTYMSVVTLVVGTEAFVLSHVLSNAFPAIAPPYWIFFMLTVASLVNFCGLKVAGAFQDIITYSVVASIVTISVLALAKVHFHVPSPVHIGAPMNLLNAIGVAIFLFVGFEWVTPLADEVKSTRAIPYGMFIALAILTGAYALITTAMFAGPWGIPHTSLEWAPGGRLPIPHIVFAKEALGPTGRWVMIVTSLFMSLTTFNAGLIGVSRFIYGMARDQILPKALSEISARFSTPYRAVLLVYVIALVVSAIVYFTGKFVLLVNLAAATESFIYAFAAASVIALRVKDPSRERPFRMAGRLWLPALTGIVFFAIGILVFTPTGIDYWGAAVVLGAVTLAWWLYIHFHAAPRLTKIREEAAAKRVSRRPSRRPASESSSD